MNLKPEDRELIATIRRHRLDYDGLRRCTYRVRQHLEMKPAKGGRHLPQLLTQDALRRFYQAITDGGDLQHEIMLRLLFYTAIRIGELVAIKVADVDLQQCKIFIELGKGDKDRYILFPDGFRLTLATHIQAHPKNVYLFESRLKDKLTTRRVRQIVTQYAASADIHVHPHLLRHQMLTYLTKEGVPDAAIQLISGHASKQSLERYQHMALGDVSERYQASVRKLTI